MYETSVLKKGVLYQYSVNNNRATGALGAVRGIGIDVDVAEYPQKLQSGQGVPKKDKSY